MSRFIEIDFTSLNLILSELQAVGERASDLRPVARTVGLVIQSYTDNVFASSPPTETGGAVANGEFWDKLTDKYLNARKGRRRNGQLLLDTGKLLQSLQVGGADNVFDSGNDFIEFGTNLPQGANNTKRPFLVATDDLVDQVVAALENYILTGET